MPSRDVPSPSGLLRQLRRGTSCRPTPSEQPFYRGRCWFRTSDLCCVKAFGLVQAVSGSHGLAGQVASRPADVTGADATAFITKSITEIRHAVRCNASVILAAGRVPECSASDKAPRGYRAPSTAESSSRAPRRFGRGRRRPRGLSSIAAPSARSLLRRSSPSAAAREPSRSAVAPPRSIRGWSSALDPNVWGSVGSRRASRRYRGSRVAAASDDRSGVRSRGNERLPAYQSPGLRRAKQVGGPSAAGESWRRRFRGSRRCHQT